MGQQTGEHRSLSEEVEGAAGVTCIALLSEQAVAAARPQAWEVVEEGLDLLRHSIVPAGELVPSPCQVVEVVEVGVSVRVVVVVAPAVVVDDIAPGALWQRLHVE